MQGGPGTPTPRGRGRGSSTGAKRGRKPRGSIPSVNAVPHPLSQAPGPSTSQPTTVQWAQPITHMHPSGAGPSDPRRTPSLAVAPTPEQRTSTGNLQSQGTALSLPGTMPVLPVGAGGITQRPGGADEDGDGDDELLPAMADDDFAAQSSWNSQSKDNLKYAVLFLHNSITLIFYFVTGCSWITSVQHNMSALKRIVDTPCPNKLSGRHDIPLAHSLLSSLICRS
jgi:hypothetical protein